MKGNKPLAFVLAICLTFTLFIVNAYADSQGAGQAAAFAASGGVTTDTPIYTDTLDTDNPADTAIPDVITDGSSSAGDAAIADDTVMNMAAPAISGSGTADSPYLVTNEAQLLAISQGMYANNYSAYYRLQNNITLTNAFTPIGSNTLLFTGTFDGNGYTITNLQIPASANFNYSGFFGVNYGTIKNLSVAGTITYSGNLNAGMIAGINNGTIQNCCASGSITSTAIGSVGMLAGYNDHGKIIQSYSTGTVHSVGSSSYSDDIGGFVGCNNWGTIENCYSITSVDDDKGNAMIGGLVGGSEGGTISYCYATGAITSSSRYSGGLIGGFGYSSATVTSCYYDTAATGQIDTGKGVPLTTSQMKLQSSFSGWDFTSIWGISPSINDGYPYLRQNMIPVIQDPIQISQFVTRLYQNVLGRAPDTAGLNYWVTGLTSQSLTGAQATTNFFLSTEFMNKNVDDTTYLSILYKTCMNRTADAAGLAYWKGIMAKGWSRKYILDQFMVSTEFKNICSSYGITAGSLTLRNSELKPGVTAFVSRLFTTFMNRAADSAGLDYWTGQIVLQGLSPKTIATSFVNSTEFQSKNLGNVQYVTSLYNGLLGRAPDTAGLNYWVGQINANPAARKTLLNQFLASSEFASICASFGL